MHTKFEAKLMADAAREEFAGVDPETLRLFRDVYLPASRDIFRTLGQTPSDVVKVTTTWLAAALRAAELEPRAAQ